MSQSPFLSRSKPHVPRLALRVAEAAEALGVSEGKLTQLARRGELPSFVDGRCRFFPVDGLRAWVESRASKPVLD